MKKLFYICSLAAILLAGNTQAQSFDVMGGSDGSTQTIAHCGFLTASQRRYTTSFATTRLVQQKLQVLGYYHKPATGIYDRASQAAVKKFQKEYGLKADGVVGPMTAQRLAFETHPSPNVRRCFRASDTRFL